MGNLVRVNSTSNNSKRHAKKEKVFYNNTIEANKEEMDAMDNSRKNSSNSMRARVKGKGRKNEGPSHQCNMN
jgi:hypothetical protein